MPNLRCSVKQCFVVALVVLAVSSFSFAALRKWNARMQELAKVLANVLPVVSTNKPLSKAEKKKLQSDTQKLMTLAHGVNMGPSDGPLPLPPEGDPTIQIVSNLFEQQTKLAYRSLQEGNDEYARSVLRSATSYCIACHTRHDRGPDFPGFDLPAKTKGMSTFEQAQYLAATRQFDEALKEFESIAANEKAASERPIEWGKALRHALTISVRVKNDPDKTIEIMNKVLELPQTPLFYREYLSAWKKTAEEWKKEKLKVVNTEEGLFAEATRLTEAARKQQQYPIDHSADLLYLRASRIVHELLSQFPMGKNTSEALYLAGQAYEMWDDRLILPMPNQFYEACVKYGPHSKVSYQCYLQFEENTYTAWTGSAGFAIPQDVQKHLFELEKLAKPIKK